MELAQLTFLAFAAFSSLRVVSYLPQIMKVASDTNGASAISYSTWGLWTGANIANALYAAINLQDLYLSAVSGVYATCCVVVIFLTMAKRRRLSRRHGQSMVDAADIKRAALVNDLRDEVMRADAALASGMRPHYAFEQELAARARRLVWHDLSTGLALGSGACSASATQHAERFSEKRYCDSSGSCSVPIGSGAR
jgi:hypothetical protein